ncbi:MAG: NAD-glutamate dehydrogenase, partial [Porticoccus sp.]|nr:NAD-glutamate dehydrogenase [Porticoccus sp.]
MEATVGENFFVALEKQISDQYPAPLAAQLLSFSRKVFDLSSLQELGEEPVEKVLKFLQGFQVFIKKVDLIGPKVQVHCPDVENCTGGTEIFIIQRDMPFLVDSV